MEQRREAEQQQDGDDRVVTGVDDRTEGAVQPLRQPAAATASGPRTSSGSTTTPIATEPRNSHSASRRLRTAPRRSRMPYAIVIVLTNVAVADDPAQSAITKPMLMMSARPPCSTSCSIGVHDVVDHLRAECLAQRRLDLRLGPVDGVAAEPPRDVAQGRDEGQEQRREAQQLPERGLRGQARGHGRARPWQRSGGAGTAGGAGPASSADPS